MNPLSINTDTVDYFQQYMPGDICFGCGHENDAGLKIRSFWQNDECICIWQAEPKHQGWPNLICGGIIATLIDCHCMASAMAIAIKNENRALGSQPEYRFATGTLNIKYLKPTPCSEPLLLKAKVVHIKKQRIYTLHCDLYAQQLKTAEAEVTAFLVYQGEHSEKTKVAFSKQ